MELSNTSYAEIVTRIKILSNEPEDSSTDKKKEIVKPHFWRFSRFINNSGFRHLSVIKKKLKNFFFLFCSAASASLIS